ncbi:MAG: DUF2231 domain-containing protein [Gemmatimonadales bacterium]
MRSRVKLAGHPLHPMLIVYPLGLLSTAVAFDVIHLVSGAIPWTEVAYYLIGAGLVGGLAAAVPGWVDWAAIPAGTRAKRVGLVHGVGNVLVLGLFAVSWLLRRGDPSAPTTGAIATGVVGAVLIAATAWLGGELVERLGVGVDDGANLDASSSLSELPGDARSVGPDRRAAPPAAYPGAERRRPDAGP